MTQACVLLAEGFEEIEATTVIDILRRAEIRTQTVGVTGDEVAGAHGIRMHADVSMSQAQAEKWDLIVLPGGTPGAFHLRDSAEVQSLLRTQNETRGRLAAICAAPIALSQAGVLNGKAATCYPGFEEQLQGAKLKQEAVVIDGNITTSRGPGTALEFALALVAQLKGDAAAAKVRKGLLA